MTEEAEAGPSGGVAAAYDIESSWKYSCLALDLGLQEPRERPVVTVGRAATRFLRPTDS